LEAGGKTGREEYTTVRKSNRREGKKSRMSYENLEEWAREKVREFLQCVLGERYPGALRKHGAAI
jgi:hypothetical protein